MPLNVPLKCSASFNYYASMYYLWRPKSTNSLEILVLELLEYMKDFYSQLD